MSNSVEGRSVEPTVGEVGAARAQTEPSRDTTRVDRHEPEEAADGDAFPSSLMEIVSKSCAEHERWLIALAHRN